MTWAPGNRSGGGVWRSLALYTANKAAKAAAQNPVLPPISGALSSTLGLFTSTGTSTLATVLNPRVATADITLSPFTSSAAGQLKIQGSLSQTLGSFLLSATVGPLQTPVVTNVSSTGVAPVVLSLTDGDYVAGKYLEWEFAGTPSKNADGSYVTPTQRGVTFIDGESWARLDLALGYNDPSGAFAFHCRILRDNENGAASVSYVDNAGNTITFNADTGGWSTDYTDTISGSVAKLNSSTGPNKSRYITVNSPYFASFHNNNVGLVSAARATVAATNSKWHAEFRIDGWNNASGKVACGVTDGTRNLDANNGWFASGTEPGSGGTAGLMVTVTSGATSTSQGGTIPAAAAGDYIILEGDTSTNQVKIYYWSLSAGALVNSGNPIATRTLTGAQIPAQWYVWQGGIKGQSNGSLSDALTFFPTTQKMAYSSGYSFYG